METAILMLMNAQATRVRTAPFALIQQQTVVWQWASTSARVWPVLKALIVNLTSTNAPAIHAKILLFAQTLM
jgi:hypothetical protein